MNYGLEQVKNLSVDLALKSKPGDCYCLIGDLGAGKTEFARAFIRALCGDITVTSPTFNILQIYEGDVPIYHFDLYRLKDESELREIGLEDAFEKGITLIEWPEIALELLPKNKKNIEIKIIDEFEREIKIS